jgi:hypothetical protein
MAVGFGTLEPEEEVALGRTRLNGDQAAPRMAEALAPARVAAELARA